MTSAESDLHNDKDETDSIDSCEMYDASDGTENVTENINDKSSSDNSIPNSVNKNILCLTSSHPRISNGVCNNLSSGDNVHFHQLCFFGKICYFFQKNQ